MKKTFVAIFYCLLIGLQAFFWLCACESIGMSRGTSILSASVSESGKLLLTLENGEVLDAGLVVGEDGLVGATGKDGLDGKSAYDLYCARFGYTGTEGEWLSDLVSGNLGAKTYTYGLEYSILPDGTLGVALGTAGNAETIVVPAKYEGYPVTCVLDGGFAGDMALRRVLLPDTVTKIGTNAFRFCVNLEEVTLPADAAIGAGAFDYCVKLVLPEEPAPELPASAQIP